MFYPVIIKNNKGEIKKVIKPKKLSKRYWEQLELNRPLGMTQKPEPVSQQFFKDISEEMY